MITKLLNDLKESGTFVQREKQIRFEMLNAQCSDSNLEINTLMVDFEYVNKKIEEYHFDIITASELLYSNSNTRRCIIQFKSKSGMEKPNCMTSINIQNSGTDEIHVFVHSRSMSVNMYHTDMTIASRIVISVLGNSFNKYTITYHLTVNNFHI